MKSKYVCFLIAYGALYFDVEFAFFFTVSLWSNRRTEDKLLNSFIDSKALLPMRKVSTRRDGYTYFFSHIKMKYLYFLLRWCEYFQILVSWVLTACRNLYIHSHRMAMILYEKKKLFYPENDDNYSVYERV